MPDDDVRAFDVDQIRTVGGTLLPEVADQMALAEEELRNTRTMWKQPFEGMQIYRKAHELWVDVGVGFGKVLVESVDRLQDTSGQLLQIADRYAETEASNTQLVEDLFDVLPRED